MSSVELRHMDKAEIERVISSFADGPPLHERVKESLGYPHARLLCELMTIGVTPFSMRSVEEYKNSEQAEFKSRLHVSNGLKASMAVGVASAIMALLATYGAFKLSSMVVIIGMVIVAAVFAVIVGLCAMQAYQILAFDTDGLVYETAEWRLVPLKDTSQEVPLCVLAKATVIKEAIPDAELMVDTLTTNRRVILDPFLVVRLGKTTYYVDVWDEPRFDNKAMTI